MSSFPSAQALQYLRKLCSHPLLVLDPSVPEHVAAVHAELGPGDWPSAQVSFSLLDAEMFHLWKTFVAGLWLSLLTRKYMNTSKS